MVESGNKKKAQNAKFAKFKSNLRGQKKSCKLSTKPITAAKMFVHELKREHNYDLQRIIGDTRREFYINVYKSVFRCWFTYAVTGLLLAVCHTFVRSAFSFCFPPLVVTIFLLWKVSLYKRRHFNFSVNDMEMFNQTQSAYFTYKTEEARRQNQGRFSSFFERGRQFSETFKQCIND